MCGDGAEWGGRKTGGSLILCEGCRLPGPILSLLKELLLSQVFVWVCVRVCVCVCVCVLMASGLASQLSEMQGSGF